MDGRCRRWRCLPPGTLSAPRPARAALKRPAGAPGPPTVRRRGLTRAEAAFRVLARGHSQLTYTADRGRRQGTAVRVAGFET
eukprot:scaffold3691_cov394-Prasinococcus_capsulatus_cf.AAC.9